MDQAESFEKDLTHFKQTHLQRLHECDLINSDVTNILECVKALNDIDTAFLKIDLFKAIHEGSQLEEITDFKQKSLEEIIYESVEESFPKTLKTISTLKFILPRYYTDFLVSIFEQNDFKDVSYLLPPGDLKKLSKENFETSLRLEFWTQLLENEETYRNHDSWLFLEDINKLCSKFAGQNITTEVLQRLQQDPSMEIMEKQTWPQFAKELLKPERADIFLKLAERIFKETGNLKTALKILEDGFFRGYSLDVLREKLMLYSIGHFMIYKTGLISVELEDLQTLKETPLINFLFESVLHHKNGSLLLLKEELKSIYTLYSSEQSLSKLFEEYLVYLDTNTFYRALTLDQTDLESTDQLMIDDDDKVYNLILKYINMNCHFSDFEFIYKVVKLLKNTLSLDSRLRLQNDLENIEFKAECLQLLANFYINDKYSSLKEFEETEKLEKPREKGINLLSQIVSSYCQGNIKNQNVTLRGKVIDLKNVRSVLAILLNLQESFMKDCVKVQEVYQVLIKNLIECGNYRDVQNLVERDRLLNTLSKEIFEVIVLEAISNILDNLPSISLLSDDINHKIEKCFSLITWKSEAKEAEESFHKACLEIQKTSLKHLSPTNIRSANKIELLNDILKGSQKATEKTRFVELYELLRKSEYKSTEADAEFIGFMANFVDSYIENNERRKIEELVQYLSENDYPKISHVLIKILRDKTVSIKAKDKKYYMKLGVMECKDATLLSEYLNTPDFPFLQEFENKAIVESPESFKVVLSNLELFTSEFSRNKTEFDALRIRDLFVDIIREIDNSRWDEELYFFFSNLTIDHKRAFKFLLQAHEITIHTIDLIIESLLKTDLYSVKNLCEFLLTYVIPELMGYPSRQYQRYGNSKDFEDIIQKYTKAIEYRNDFASFETLVNSKDKSRFLFDEDFRKDLISTLIVSTHSEPRIIEKAYKYGLNVNSINLKLLESKFISFDEENMKIMTWEIKTILEKISTKTKGEKETFINALIDIYEHAHTLKYFPQLVQIVSEKHPNVFDQKKIKYLQALIAVDAADDFKQSLSLNSVLQQEYQSPIYDKPLDLKRVRETMNRVLEECNVFIVAKCLPVLISPSITPHEVYYVMLNTLVCQKSFLWQDHTLEQIYEGRTGENIEVKLLIERIDMLMAHLDYDSLSKLLQEIVNIKLGIKNSTDETTLLNSLRLALNYQEFFIEKIKIHLKRLQDKAKRLGESLPNQDSQLTSIVAIKIKLINQMSTLYQKSLSKVVSIHDFWGIRSPTRLSDFIFGLFTKEVITSSMLVNLIKDLGKEVFVQGYLKNELSAKLEETSIGISDQLSNVWDTAISFREIISSNRQNKFNFEVKFETVQKNNEAEFENVIRFLQKTYELLILDEDFENSVKDSLAQVLVSMVIENHNYSFRMKLQLLHIAFQHLPQISFITQSVTKDYILEIFSLLDKAFPEFDSTIQFDKSLLNILLAENPNVPLVQLFDTLVFAQKTKPFYQNLVLRDIALRLPSEELILHSLTNLINFNYHENSEMIFDLFFVRKTKAVKLEREISTKNIMNLFLEDMAFKINSQTKEKLADNVRHLIEPISPDSKDAHLIYKYLIHKGRIHILKRTEHYDYCLRFACELFRAQSRQTEISQTFGLEEVLDYDQNIHEICMHDLWVGKTLEHVVLKNAINLIENETYIEAAKIVSEYHKDGKQDKNLVSVDKMFESLKSFLQNITRQNKPEYRKLNDTIRLCSTKVNKL